MTQTGIARAVVLCASFCRSFHEQSLRFGDNAFIFSARFVLFCFFVACLCVCVCEEKQPKAIRKNGLNLPEVDKKGVAKSSMSGPELHESEILAAQGTAVWDTLGKCP